MTTEITKGHRVAFSRAFLRSTGQFTGWAPFARGTVEAFNPLGGITLARIAWADGARSSVNVNNLVRVDRLHLEPV